MILTLWDVEAVLEVSSETSTIFYSPESLLNTKQPTNWRSDGQGDAVAALLDQVDDVAVVEGVDLHVVHGQNSVSNLEATASLCWRACKYETFLSVDFKHELLPAAGSSNKHEIYVYQLICSSCN